MLFPGGGGGDDGESLSLHCSALSLSGWATHEDAFIGEAPVAGDDITQEPSSEGTVGGGTC